MSRVASSLLNAILSACRVSLLVSVHLPARLSYCASIRHKRIDHLNFLVQFVFGINWDKVCVLAHTLLDSSGGLEFRCTRQMINYPNTRIAFSVVN